MYDETYKKLIIDVYRKESLRELNEMYYDYLEDGLHLCTIGLIPRLYDGKNHSTRVDLQKLIDDVKTGELDNAAKIAELYNSDQLSSIDANFLLALIFLLNRKTHGRKYVSKDCQKHLIGLYMGEIRRLFGKNRDIYANYRYMLKYGIEVSDFLPIVFPEGNKIIRADLSKLLHDVKNNQFGQEGIVKLFQEKKIRAIDANYLAALIYFRDNR